MKSSIKILFPVVKPRETDVTRRVFLKTMRQLPYYLTYNTPSVISRPLLLVAVLLSKIRLLPATRMAVLSYKSCFITEVIG